MKSNKSLTDMGLPLSSAPHTLRQIHHRQPARAAIAEREDAFEHLQLGVDPLDRLPRLLLYRLLVRVEPLQRHGRPLPEHLLDEVAVQSELLDEAALAQSRRIGLVAELDRRGIPLLAGRLVVLHAKGRLPHARRVYSTALRADDKEVAALVPTARGA